LQEPGSGQFQRTSRRNFAPFTTSTFTDIHASPRAWGTARGTGSGCEIHSAREGGHHTNCIEYKTSARLLRLESLARGCSGSKFCCAPGPAVQGRSSRAPSPARPSLNLDHALPPTLSPLDQVAKSLNTIGKPQLTKLWRNAESDRLLPPSPALYQNKITRVRLDLDLALGAHHKPLYILPQPCTKAYEAFFLYKSSWSFYTCVLSPVQSLWWAP